MELYTEILAHFLAQENAQIIFPQLQLSAKDIIEMQCYKTLLKIHLTMLVRTTNFYAVNQNVFNLMIVIWNKVDIKFASIREINISCFNQIACE